MSRSALDALSVALGLGASAQDVLRPLRELYVQLDQRLAEGAAGLGLPCKLGCDACCHEAVFVCAAEFLLVAEAVLKWPTVERQALVADMVAIAERFEDELELLELLSPGEERDEVAERVRFSCPLLSAQGGCRVYAVRELNARTFGQSMDEARSSPYGCDLTHARLRVIQAPALYGARQARRELVARVPGTEPVHVYPWWFSRHREVFM